MPQTDELTREMIIKLESQNYSVCEISKLTKVHKATVSRVILRFKERGSLENRKSPGRPKKITTRMERIVVRDSKKYPFFNITQIKNSSNVGISRASVKKIFVKYGLVSRVCPKKPKIGGPNRQKRPDCANNLFSEKDANSRKTGEISDEATLESNINNPLGIPAKPMLPLNRATPQTIQTCFDGYSGDNKENIPPPGTLNLTASSTNDLATAGIIEDLVTSLETEAIGSSTTNSLMPKGDHMISTKTKKTRTTFTKAQKEALFWHFSQKRYLGLVDRARLANDLNLSEKQIKIWFQNQRSKLRKEYADVGDNLSADDNLMMQSLQMPPKEFCSKNAHTAPATYACPQPVGMEVGSLGDEGRDREHEEDAGDIYSSSNQQRQASTDGCHKTQQQMLDEIAEDEEERQPMNATATALTHKHLPYQQHVEKVAADSTFENNPLVMDCPSV